MFNGASNLAEGVDMAFMVILGISIALLILVTVVMVYFVIRYRHKKNPKATDIKGNHTLEIIWTLIPTALVVVMFYYGWLGYQPMRDIPKGAEKIKVVGRMWSWTFEYSNGVKQDEMIVPLNRDVALDLESVDVVHSFYVPAFRIKEDAVPGQTTQMWFKPTELGTYDILCAEYCGLRHAYMIAKLKVVPEKEYFAWFAEAAADTSNDNPADAGYDVARSIGCLACHSSDGTKLVGSTFKNLFGSSKKVTDVKGNNPKTITVDEKYLSESILEPNVLVVDGYAANMMPSYEGQLSEEEIQQIIAFIKSLGAEE